MTRAFLLLVLIPLLLMAGKRDALKHYQRASDLFRKAEYAAAIPELERSLELDGDNPAVMRLLGICYHLTGDLGAAERTFARARKADPRDPQAAFLLGRVQYLQNFFDQALRTLQMARELNPGDSRVYELLALTHEALGENAKAVSAYEQALRGEPPFTVYVNYGALLHKLDRLEESQRQLDKATDLAPREWLPHFERGRLLFRRGKLTEAIAALERAAILNPPDADAPRVFRRLALAYARAGREADAQAAYARAGDR